MKALFQIEIPKRADTCAKSGVTFEPGNDYYSLWNGEVRQDFTPEAWKEVAQEGVFWKGKVPLKKIEPVQEFSRDERAFHLLKQSLKGETEEEKEECFILSLLLARRKILLLRQSTPEHQIYEVAATEEMLAVPKIALSALNVESVQKRLSDRFYGKVPAGAG